MFASTSNPESRRRRIAGLALGVVLTGCLAGAYLALSPESHPSDESVSTAPPPPSGAAGWSGASARTAVLRPLARISDPERFSEAVAHALFDWDTAAPIALTEYASRLLAVADPTGSESAGLTADVASYLPTEDAWANLKPYYTQQWIEIQSIAVPDLWSQALSEAGPRGFAPGTAAYTIEGVRHRTGVWEGDDVSSAHDVSFTVFVVCGPTYSSCHLLRLSRLDEPLE